MIDADDLGLQDVGSDGRQEPSSSRLLKQLLTSLLVRTVRGHADWEVDDAHEDSFCLAGEGWLVATRSVDSDGRSPFALVVANASGEPVLEVTSTSAYGRPLLDLFTQLHMAAASTATLRRSEGLLARIVSDLDAGREGEPERSTQ